MTNVPAFTTLQEAVAAARGAPNASEAAAIFRSLPAQFPTKEGIICAAAGLRACGEWREAIAVMEEEVSRISRLRISSHGLVHFLADAYQEANQLASAAACLQRHLEIIPEDVASWISLGRIHSATENWRDAEQAFAHALSLSPLDTGAALGLGDALYRLGRPDEAISAYRRAVTLTPDDPTTLFKLGSLLAVAERAEEAESLLRRAIALSPQNAGAYVNLAGVLQQSGRLGEAAEVSHQALALDAGFIAAYSTLGTVLLEAGQFAAAAEVLREGMKLAPDQVAILIALVTAENALGNISAAEKVLQRILVIEPGNLEARHLLSAINGEPVRSVPAGYSRQLFNWYAPKFDRMPSGLLKYRAPDDMVALLRETRPDSRAFAHLLDLGCGTGLVAQALAEHYAIPRRTGVDVAEKMIDVSRKKGLYDALIHGDAAEALAGAPNTFDLITAIDLFIYVGDLTALMPLIAGSLTAGGLFAYSIEVLAEGKYKLQRNGRFAHTVKYVEDLAQAAGLVPVVSQSVSLRLENNADVTGRIGTASTRLILLIRGYAFAGAGFRATLPASSRKEMAVPTKSRQVAFAVLLGVLASGAFSSGAFAHAKLMASSPVKDGEGASPSEIALTFNEPVTPAVVTLSDQDGHEVKVLGTPRTEAAVLHVPVTGKLAPGRYTLTYRIAGADTHVVNGALTFVVAKP